MRQQSPSWQKDILGTWNRSRLLDIYAVRYSLALSREQGDDALALLVRERTGADRGIKAMIAGTTATPGDHEVGLHGNYPAFRFALEPEVRQMQWRIANFLKLRNG
ncbi:hypothetical protein [Chelatococcus asaccharovorans]|uniref:Uncharacterized protein n=1 Tax=Chelatococcus asaccharovorans TaxID=28210 RepID=A0A2V3TRC3_9HYPH|nr:hypothetical protein [Chelatococcus asaccharovorans]MBS7707990.1 hypothetical protein [Chelatococcus asaccharovorans]PXW50534.1 hypothetical protein C7450_12612 [Chelatococcus asaccharovorans]